MQDRAPGRYGATFADVYDEWYGDVSDIVATVAGLRSLSDGHPTLELGVGTGRLAIPLAAAGEVVYGLDASVEMIEVLTSKPQPTRVLAAIGDMTRLPFVDSTMGVVFAAFNTFFNLATTDSQQACFSEAARVLRPGGRFAVEAFVPPPEGMPERGASVRDAGEESVTVTTTRHDPTTQVIVGEHVQVTPDEVTRRPWVIRYAYPAQLDAMAEAVALELETRLASWAGEPHHEGAAAHVSVYRRTTAPAPGRGA